MPSVRVASASIATLLKACKTQFRLEQIHAQIIHKGLEQDHFLITQFICLSNALSSLPYSTAVFRRVNNPSSHLWNSLLKGHCERSSFSATVSLFIRMKREDGAADEYTYPSVVKACAGVGDMVGASKVFGEMPERNAVSWNVVISGFVRLGDLGNARRVFEEMPGKDVVSFTTMIDGYAKSGDMASARFLFEQAPVKDIVMWSALISGYAQNGFPNQAVKIFLEMSSRNVEPDEFIMVSLMSACSQVGCLELAEWVDSYLSNSSIDIRQPHVLAALIDMNAKCGNMERATSLFENMPKRDLISYCSMIQGLSIHGRGNQAVALFNRMLSEGLAPDEVAFTVILTACSRSELVEEGRHFFELMRHKYSMVPTPDHYACMVDLLSRSGWLEEAYELLQSMPVEPHAGAWGALLGACKLHCNVEFGELVANRLFVLEPKSAGSYVLLSDIYAAFHRWLDVSVVRNKMQERGLKKIPGISSI